MNRIIARAMAALLVLCLLSPPAAATRIEARVYVGGAGVLDLPTCGGATSTSLLGVCFALVAGDATVDFEIREDVGLLSVLGTAYFVNATGGVVGTVTAFCKQSPSLPIPATAVAARVVLGPLPDVADVQGCPPGVATTGRVIGRFA